MSDVLTKKQQEALMELVTKEQVDQEKDTRYIMERFVDDGIAFKNFATKRVTTSGKVRKPTEKYVKVAYYSPSPRAYKLMDALKAFSEQLGAATGKGQRTQTAKAGEQQKPKRQYRTRTIEAKAGL